MAVVTGECDQDHRLDDGTAWANLKEDRMVKAPSRLIAKDRKPVFRLPANPHCIANNPPASRSPGAAPAAAVVTNSVFRSEPPKVQVVIFLTGISITRSIFPIRRDPHNTTAIVAAIPEISVGIHGRAVWQTAFEAGKKIDLVPDRCCGLVIIVCPDRIRQRVSKVETPPVRTPAQRVRDSDVAPMQGRCTVRSQAIENAILAASFSGRAVRSLRCCA